MPAALLLFKSLFLPLTVCAVLITFRREIRDLLRRTVRIRLWGAELEAVPPEPLTSFVGKNSVDPVYRSPEIAPGEEAPSARSK